MVAFLQMIFDPLVRRAKSGVAEWIEHALPIKCISWIHTLGFLPSFAPHSPITRTMYKYHTLSIFEIHSLWILSQYRLGEKFVCRGLCWHSLINGRPLQAQLWMQLRPRYKLSSPLFTSLSVMTSRRAPGTLIKISTVWFAPLNLKERNTKKCSWWWMKSWHLSG